MLTQDDKLILIGLTSIVLQQRKDIAYTETIIQKTFESHGVSPKDSETWASEIAYNEGDDPIEAVNRVLSVLDLEVEPA